MLGATIQNRKTPKPHKDFGSVPTHLLGRGHFATVNANTYNLESTCIPTIEGAAGEWRISVTKCVGGQVLHTRIEQPLNSPDTLEKWGKCKHGGAEDPEKFIETWAWVSAVSRSLLNPLH